jgi:hypothetical protein
MGNFSKANRGSDNFFFSNEKEVVSNFIFHQKLMITFKTLKQVFICNFILKDKKKQFSLKYRLF